MQHPDIAALDYAQGLDSDQLQAAAAIASTDPLVIIEGAAGSGKTTMLRPAIAAAKADGRRTRVVAPTKKAAHVAGQALDIPTDSVAALVHAHGFRWNSDGVWTRLNVGDIDSDAGHRFTGPPSESQLARGERVVVDEAGMLDQDTAIALLTITQEVGATVALVGDRAQLAAVGRGGVLDIAAQIRGTTYDMTGLHRFTNPAYAPLTLRLRDGTDPGAAFDQLQAMGLIRLHDSEETMREQIAATAAPGDAVTVATNEDARALNARIQDGRLNRGDFDRTRTVTGSEGRDMGAGDAIQARKNDSTIGVANRQTFTVQHVSEDGTVYAVENGNDRKYQRTVRLPPEYVEAHAHLAYASTAYGVQGVTVADSHTVLDDAISAAGLYVGLTRGTDDNTLHVIAATEAEAREQFVTAMTRDRADRGLDHAAAEAHAATRGLITDGPVAFVNTERERLAEAITHAETQAARWEQAEVAITVLRHTHATEREEHKTVATAAEQHAQQVREEVIARLAAEALTDGQTVLTSQEEVWDAGRALQQAGRLRRRSAARIRDNANHAHDRLQAVVQQRWGSVPRTPESLDAWAHTVAENQAEQHPAVVDAERELQDTKTAAGQVARKQLAESQQLRSRIYGKTGRAPVGGPSGRAAHWRNQATELHSVLSKIETLPTAEAAQLIRQRHAETEARRLEAERARAERAEQIRSIEHEERPRADPHRERGIGF